MVFLITYDLKSPNDTSDDYRRVIDALKATYRTWCHLEKSVWLIETWQDAATVREAIRPYLYGADVLFVARLQGNWGSTNLAAEQTAWLKERTF
jgi:hypothetical protein